MLQGKLVHGLRQRRGAVLMIGLLLCGVASFGAAAPAAEAAIGPPLLRFGEFGIGGGISAGGYGGGLAADPASGHIFVSDISNNRIDEYTAWGEFVKAWGWGVANGSPGLQACGPLEPELEPEASLCREGIAGAAVGQLNRPNGIALAPNGDLYVVERQNRRVQVFSRSGAFVTMFGGGVDETSGANVCSAANVAGGDVCGAGSEGTGPSQFSVGETSGTQRSYIAAAPNGKVYVGDRNRIQVFEADGGYLESLSLPETGLPSALAVDPSSGDLYFSFASSFEPAHAYRLSAITGKAIYPLPTTAPEAIAVDQSGDVFVADDPEPIRNTLPEFNPHLVELNQAGKVVDECCSSTSRANEVVKLSAVATNTVTSGGGADLYVLHSSHEGEPGQFEAGAGFVEVRGPAPDKWPPPSVPPKIEAQHAISVGETVASFGATINPNFWADTSYRLEYGTAPCSLGGCRATASKGLGAGIVRQPVASEAIELSGLQPGTTYHYRFLAESGGGGPVLGPDRTFTTFAAEPPQAACPNDAFRAGAGAGLADCRAYEMVSPLDKGGGDVLVPVNLQGLPARLDQAAPDGEAVTYSSYRSFGDAESAPYASQYLARRGPSGWSTEGISPPQQDGVFNGGKIDSSYKGFSEDLASGWLVQESEPTLAAGAIPGYPNLYRRDGESGSYEALSVKKPTNVGPQDYGIELQGFSAGDDRTIFRANEKLTENASSAGGYQVYEAFNGKLRLVSVKPDGTAAGASSVGSPGTVANNREANVATAVSEDGTKIYWGEIGGNLYVRVNAVKTVAVSAGAATFWAAKPDGSQAIYQEGGALKLFTLATGSSVTLVGEGVEGVLGESKDLSRIYLVSSAALGGGAAGKPNLYLYEAGQPLRFIATLSPKDVEEGSAPAVVAVSPWLHLAQVAADGSSAVFMSRGALTGADNIDSASGEADAEVFRYDATGHQLRCLSCSPTGQAPRHGRLLEKQTTYFYASRIPGAEFQLHDPRVIADNGARVFFDSLNRLLPADTNEAEDVYEWEAPGTGTCVEGGSGFSPETGGCISLVSSGKSERKSEFVDASADGRDVFFLTVQSLVSWDPGQVDLYDAREGGGLPAPPPARLAECEGEACQAQIPPPSVSGNASEAAGSGNPHFKPRCRKEFARKHGKCVKKHSSKGDHKKKGKAQGHKRHHSSKKARTGR